MYISVIPLAKSLSRDPYIYFVGETWEQQIVVSGIVEIPIATSLVYGVVFRIEEEKSFLDTSMNIRPIHRVVSSTPIIDPTSLPVIVALSNKYYLPIHKALSLFLPAPLLTRLEKRNYVLERKNLGKFREKRNTSIHHFTSRTFSPNDFQSYLEEGTVIVFPDDVFLSLFTKDIDKRDNICILKNESTVTKRMQTWIDIYEGKYSIIVGTRKILYYNLEAFQKIVYIEDAFGDEQFQYPIRIRSLDILSAISEYQNISLTIVTSSPTLELFSRFPKVKITSKL